MGIYFGTDGIRGVVNDFLTFEVGYKCGNALCTLQEKPKVVIGRDSRISGDYLTLAVSGGIIAGGGSVIDVGICPTPCVAYLTKYLKCDYGVVISASHNPPEHNGIKIFDRDGSKLGDVRENELEKKFVKQTIVSSNELGSYAQRYHLVDKYIEYLCSNCDFSLSGLTVVLDGSNGATYKIAPKVFRKLGARVFATNCKKNGYKINHNCGAVYPETLSRNVKRFGGDVGFSFDGDGDRLIACDENGKIVDGDQIIYILARQFKNDNKLTSNTVVGTVQTNKGIEDSLNNYGIDLIRTDVGDKYVSAKMTDLDLVLGGEKAGHIIIKDYITTGDGIFAAIKIAEIMKKRNVKISEINDAQIYPQVNINVGVKSKEGVLFDKQFIDVVDYIKETLGHEYRVLVRPSGTENKIRIMVEGANEEKAKWGAQKIEKVVKELGE